MRFVGGVVIDGDVAVPGTADCIVVNVVASERTEGAGEEKVLSTPRPAPAVPVVASPEE